VAARLGAWPRSSWAGSQQAECDGSEQCPLRATRWQVDADARNVLDHARPELDQALSGRRELSAGERARLRDRGASVMSAVALGWYAMQLVSTPICYVNRALSISCLTHNPG
jgi:hypothetical protein